MVHITVQEIIHQGSRGLGSSGFWLRLGNVATGESERAIQKLCIQQMQETGLIDLELGPPGDGAQLDVVVARDHLLGELPHLLAVEEQDALLRAPRAGHLGQGERRDRGRHVDPAAVADGGRAAEVEAGAEPPGGGGGRAGGGRPPRECGGARGRARAGRGSDAGRAGGGGGGGRCHPRHTGPGLLLDVAAVCKTGSNLAADACVAWRLIP